MALVLVFAETVDTVVTERCVDLIAVARGIAGDGGEVAAVVVDRALPTSGLEGANRIYRAESAAAVTSEMRIEAILEIDRRIQPDVLLIPNSIAGMDVAAAVALRAKKPLIAYCVDLALRDGQAVARCQMFGGRAVGTVECATPTVVLANLDAAGATAAAGAAPEVILFDLPSAPARIIVQSVRQAEVTSIDIAKAERIVCVGRGIGEAENIELAKSLAEVLGAELAASRPLVDLGWVEKDRQVGKSGRTVKPKLYIGLGVSGAAEHLEGMRDAETIVAVNINRSAPIFEVAQWGTTCDVTELLPALTEKLRAARD